MRPGLFPFLLSASLAAPALAAPPNYADPDYYRSYRHTPGTSNVGVPPRQPFASGRKLKEITSNNDAYEFDLGLDLGYRNDKLKWNIASDTTGTQTPNILSELTWKNVGGYQVAPRFEYTNLGYLEGLHLEGGVYRSVTTSGNNQDSDYFGDNRSLEFSRSNNSADAGHAQGFHAGIGYAFDFKGGREQTLARFTTLIGYSQQDQKFMMRDGFQTLSTPGITPPLGPFGGLNSSYETSWRAPYIGFAATGYFATHHHLKLSGKYFRGDYTGEANWNLRTDFAHPLSYRHEADADGYQLGLEYGWQFTPHVAFTLSGNYQYLKTDPGLDRTFFSNGTSADTRLNKVQHYTQQYMAGIDYLF